MTHTESKQVRLPESLGTRDRIVQVTARLLQRQGYEGTPIKQIAQAAGATLGSVYHFFPGGKQELAAEAIGHGDQEFADLLREGLATASDPADALIAVTRLLAEGLRESDWTDGCPVTATALETLGRAPDIQRACDRALRNWQDIVADRLIADGLDEPDARELACTVINALEGAEVTAQVRREEEPLLVAGRHLARLVRSYR
ncbi:MULTISPECIES: TetR/AcrR family transcriptional regulator [Actinoalloteichus]|uniref:Transcriptional regulator, TetR family n=1 Tax=Actinoalloteichus fjordicus TaxID=1612552 RepID=A0AAC9LCP8_9PSEU|nr:MULTISPECIES: TetR/AcrR family transcriptional regulator [Actinoalloteichus]APU14906.1 transcriptional regulator, TetR family [Actinoalloteichus fjordicus]APU20876.1 transcriptional regulator, TetR family [Actinoalloteichus sp. GBA129-24]